MRARTVLATPLALAVALAFVATAAAIPPRPADLHVRGGEDAWHAENRFTLEWTNPPTGAGPPLAGVGYRIRDPLGGTVGETRISWVSDGIAAIPLPKVPGTYSAEVWLVNSADEAGPAATARLRFDDTKPAAIAVQPVPRWIGRATFPLRVKFGHPSAPLPISGIRGYAAAIDRVPSGSPCGGTGLCSEAETVLRGGAGDDTLTIAALPEGTSYLHAAAVSGSGIKSPVNGQAVLRVDMNDPVTQLLGAPSGWTNQAVGLIASATDAGSGMEVDGTGPPPYTAIRVDDGAPSLAPGGSATATVIGEGAHRIAFYARDTAGNTDDGAGANHAPRTAWVRIDRSPPTLAFANFQDDRDPELIRVEIADPLAGADLSRGLIGIRRARSGDPFEPLPSVPSASGELRARWDRSAYPAGEYEFRAIGYDVAGNAAVTTRRGNGEPMTLSIPPKAPTALRADLGGRALRTVAYGRGVRLTGRLDTGASPTATGTPIRIVERFGAGADTATRVSTAWTEADGSFSIRLAPGPSRELAASFDGNAAHGPSTSRTLRVKVRSAVHLSASSGVARVGGAPLVFRGGIAAAPGTIPDGGQPVELQFRLPGLPWTEFRTIRTDRRGRFRYAYRFSDDDSRGVRFQFRAYAPAHDDWPYEPGGSRPIIVLGR